MTQNTSIINFTLLTRIEGGILGERSGYYVQQSAGYSAFIPKSLPPVPQIALDQDMLVLLSNADRALARLDGISYILPNADLFVAMFVKKEAVLSSQIEGTQSSLIDVLEFEALTKPIKGVDDVAEVINYVKAMNHGLERLQDLPFSLRLIREIHGVLMAGVRGSDKDPGQFRKSQNWIGPSGALLADATFVPPPPVDVIDAMSDFEKFVHSDSKMPPLVKCALIHYQFETIHPFLDGNGRIGRLLITFYLCWQDILNRPLLYLSYYLKRNRQEYYDLLSKVRDKDAYEEWVDFFLKGILEVSDQAASSAKQIISLQKADTQKIVNSGISSSSAIILLDWLFTAPIVNVSEVAHKLDVTKQTATTLISKLEKIGILKEITGKSRNRYYAYSRYLEILNEGTNPLI
jgi:Fic family protein